MAIFRSKLIETTEACRLFDKLTTDESEHNCLGCQFMDLHQLIYENFRSLPTDDLSVEFFCKTYIFWLYLSVERVYEIFDIINPRGESQIFKSFFEKNFKTTKRIKRWANFLKHPKAFQFTHHPSYRLSVLPVIENDPKITLIDSSFVERYYQGNSRNTELNDRLIGKEEVCVVFPDLPKLTKEFCAEFQVFVNFICNNDMVADFLRSRSTIKAYYEFVDHEENSEA